MLARSGVGDRAPRETVEGSNLDDPGFSFREGLFVERRHLRPLLEALTPDGWDGPTLCEGGRVRDVVAHLTYSRSNTVLGRPTWLRHRNDIDLAVTLYAQQRARADASVLLRRYRNAACGFVDLVADRGDFGASGGDDAADVQGCAPVQTGADADRVWWEVVPLCDLAGGARRSDRYSGNSVPTIW